MPCRCIIAIAVTLIAGCAARPKEGNSSFDVTIERAQADLKRMANDPRPLRRPIVILGGYADPGVGGWAISAELRKYLPADARIVTVSFTFCDSFDACRQRVIETVDRELPTDDPEQTVEVDVIGLSMGGLVGRFSAADVDGIERRLRVHTLFTIASPHRGALRAEQWPQVSRMQADMTPGSQFCRRLEDLERQNPIGYELVPYVRIGDTVVGAEYAAPKGRTAWWVPDVPGEFTHIAAMRDPRIMADVLRRLRGERPWTTHPPAPLPD